MHGFESCIFQHSEGMFKANNHVGKVMTVGIDNNGNFQFFYQGIKLLVRIGYTFINQRFCI